MPATIGISRCRFRFRLIPLGGTWPRCLSWHYWVPETDSSNGMLETTIEWELFVFFLLLCRVRGDDVSGQPLMWCSDWHACVTFTAIWQRRPPQTGPHTDKPHVTADAFTSYASYDAAEQVFYSCWLKLTLWRPLLPAVEHPVPDQVKFSFVIFWHPGTLTLRPASECPHFIGLTRSDTSQECFIAVAGNSGRQRVKVRSSTRTNLHDRFHDTCLYPSSIFDQ